MGSGLLFHPCSPSNLPCPFPFSLYTSPLSPPQLPPLCSNYRRRWREFGVGVTRNLKSDRNSKNQLLDGDGSGGGGNYVYGRFRRSGDRKRRRRWWYDDDEDVYEHDDSSEPGPDILEEFVHSFWFFKLLGSYGWVLPVIILSLLLATGPKAFFSALSLPLGFSVLTFAFRMLWGWTQGRFRYRSKRKKKLYARNLEIAFKEENEEEMWWKREHRRQHRLWIGSDNNSNPLQNNGAATLRGWEELIEQGELETSNPNNSGTRKDKMETPLGNGELNRTIRGRDLPLLLRLLVTLFPFLSAWVDLLW